MVGLEIVLGIVILILIILAPNHLQDQTFVLTDMAHSTMTTGEKIMMSTIIILSVIFVVLLKVLAG